MVTMSGHQDLILICLEQEREICFLNTSREDAEKAWNDRVLQLLPVFGPAIPNQSTEERINEMKFESNDGITIETGRPEIPLDRTQSTSQHSAPMSRKRSSDKRYSTSTSFLQDGEDTSYLALANCQLNRTEPFSNYTVTSSPKMQRTASKRRRLLSVTEIDPEDTQQYFDHKSVEIAIPFDNTTPQTSQQLFHSPMESSCYGSPLNLALSPSTSSTSDLTTATSLTNSMSRESSFASVNIGGFAMMNLHSQASDMSNLSAGEEKSAPELHSSLAFANEPNFNFFEYDQDHLLDHTGGGVNECTLQPSPVVSVTFASSIPSSIIVEENGMERSLSNESNASTLSRASRRHQEQLAQSERLIAPKVPEKQRALFVQPASLDHQMTRMKSGDGSDKLRIMKSSYCRPEREKVKCDRCNEKPDGFRGKNELNRHVERAHCEKRKVWVCVDQSVDKTQLADCKHCRGGKKYNAYYNAAQHLRRVHFNPKSKNRKNKGSFDERRGGISGGNIPPMDEMKKWMREIEEVKSDGVDREHKHPGVISREAFFMDDKIIINDGCKPNVNSTLIYSEIQSSSTSELSYSGRFAAVQQNGNLDLDTGNFDFMAGMNGFDDDAMYDGFYYES